MPTLESPSDEYYAREVNAFRTTQYCEDRVSNQQSRRTPQRNFDRRWRLSELLAAVSCFILSLIGIVPSCYIAFQRSTCILIGIASAAFIIAYGDQGERTASMKLFMGGAVLALLIDLVACWYRFFGDIERADTTYLASTTIGCLALLIVLALRIWKINSIQNKS